MTHHKYRLPSKAMLNNPRVVAGQGDLQRMGLCPNGNAQNSQGSRSWLPNVKLTVVSLHLHKTGQKLERRLPLVPGTLSVLLVVSVLALLLVLVLVPVLVLALLLVLALVLVLVLALVLKLAPNRLVQNPRNESTPRGRRRMGRQWISPFLPPKAAVSSLWNNVQRTPSRLRLSRSASPLGHRRPTILRSPRTRKRISQNLHTTMLCLSSMLSPMLEHQ